MTNVASAITKWQAAKARYLVVLPNLACALGMAVGYKIDMWRSPIGMPSMNMRSKGLFSELLHHVQTMPMAHIGMGIGGVLCAVWHLGQRATKPIALLRALLWTFGGMSAAEAGALMIPAQLSTGALMAVMVVFMIAFGCVPLPKGLRAAKASPFAT